MSPTEGPAIRIDRSLVDKAMKDIKIGESPGPSEITAKMLKISGGVGL